MCAPEIHEFLFDHITQRVVIIMIRVDRICAVIVFPFGTRLRYPVLLIIIHCFPSTNLWNNETTTQNGMLVSSLLLLCKESDPYLETGLI